MAVVSEIQENVFRINLTKPGGNLSYSLFVIRDRHPTLIETSFNKRFDEVRDAVASIIDPRTIRYLVAPHFEADECGSINRFLELAPEAVPVCSPICARGSMGDWAIRDPMAVEDNQTLDLGQRRLRFLITPQIHQWDSLMVYEEEGKILFSSDLFTQPGEHGPVAYEDLTEEMVRSYQRSMILPSRPHLDAALDRIERLDLKLIAAHHGSVVGAHFDRYIRALRENEVTGLVAPRA